MNIKKFITNRPNLITNLDPDGFASAIVLMKYIKGCQIVGFSNSIRTVAWKPRKYVGNIYSLDRDKSKNEKVTYIDMFIKNPGAQSIDQHIVAIDNTESERLRSYGTKLNPNIDSSTTVENYISKYPYSTLIYVLSLIGMETPIEIDWDKNVTDELKVWHFLLDVDGVLSNYCNYNPNCKFWLDTQFPVLYGQNNPIYKIRDYLDSVSLDELLEISKKVRAYHKAHFNTETNDGGFETLNSTNVSNIKKQYNFFANLLNFDGNSDFISGEVIEYEGEAQRIPENKEEKSLAFSYAYPCWFGNNLSMTKKPQEKCTFIV